MPLNYYRRRVREFLAQIEDAEAEVRRYEEAYASAMDSPGRIFEERTGFWRKKASASRRKLELLRAEYELWEKQQRDG